MTCHEVRLRLVRYADNDLPAADHVAVETHLDHCYLCLEELNDIVALLDSCRDALRHPRPADHFDDLRPRLRYPRPEARRRVRVLRRLVSVAAVAASIIILISVGNSVFETARRFVIAAERMETAPEPDSPVAEPSDASMPALETWRQRISWAQALSVRPAVAAEETALQPDTSDAKPGDAAKPVSCRQVSRGRLLLARVPRAHDVGIGAV